MGPTFELLEGPAMSDAYAINVAKTELREGYNTGDVDRLLKVFRSEGFTDMPEGEPNNYGMDAISAFRKRLTDTCEFSRCEMFS